MKTNQKYQILINALLSIVLLIGVFILGIYIGYNRKPESERIFSVINKEIPEEVIADFEPFWKVWNILSEKSIQFKDVSDQDRIWGAIEGLASSLNDPYTIFLPPEDNKTFNEEIAGSFEGIGAEIDIRDDILTVVAPLKNTPSFKSGLKAGDKILKIDDVITNDMSIDEAISLIRGQKGTTVTLTILRAEEKDTRQISIVRDKIDVPALETKLIEDNIFVISFYSFSEKATILFRNAMIEFLSSGSTKLIIDLRGNPGGYLDSAIDIASLFIDEGKPVVGESFGDGKETKIYRSHGPKLFNKDLSLVVLVDEGSASASEILAGALKEYGVGVLVGEKTFGKGSVQELIKITPETSLKVTVANWLTPNGISISLQGLEPDIKVPYTNKDFEEGIDPQMNKAVEILKAK